MSIKDDEREKTKNSIHIFFIHRLNQQQMERIEVQSTACLPDINATHSIILHLCRSFTPSLVLSFSLLRAHADV